MSKYPEKIVDCHMINLKTLLSLIVVILVLGCVPMKQDRRPYPEEALSWQLGAQAYTFNRFTFTEALDKIADCNLHYVEAYSRQEIGGGIKEQMNYRMSENSKTY